MLSLPTVGAKEFRQNMRKYARAVKRGKTFVVKSHNEVLFKIVPADKQNKIYTLEDMMNIRFSHPDKNLSKKVDEIVYDL